VKPEGQNAQVYEKSPLSAVDKPKTPFGMAVPMPLRHPPTQKEILQANRQANAQLAPSAPIPLPNSANPNIIFQHIHEMASKRISTLDYLRKACVSLYLDKCSLLTAPQPRRPHLLVQHPPLLQVRPHAPPVVHAPRSSPPRHTLPPPRLQPPHHPRPKRQFTLRLPQSTQRALARIRTISKHTSYRRQYAEQFVKSQVTANVQARESRREGPTKQQRNRPE
jgi:hypothetical protein